MSGIKIVVVALAAVLLFVFLGVGYWLVVKDDPEAVRGTEIAATSEATTDSGDHGGLLYGRITTVEGSTYEGRLRWRKGNEEAFWSDAFNGVKAENPWATPAVLERLPRRNKGFEVFGFELRGKQKEADVQRPFTCRFGDLRRIEAEGKDVRVTLKSGTVIDLDRLNASDFDDGVRVWDAQRGVTDLDSLRIRSIELLPTGPLIDPPTRLHGTLRTRRGETFTGFVHWNRHEGVGTDTLDGQLGSADGESGEPGDGEWVRVRYDGMRSIERGAPEGVRVTLTDGREMVLSGSPEAGDGHRGTYVDDARYGRVLVPWNAFERVDFEPAAGGPGYDDFPPGRPLTGTVTTHDGHRLTGRLVYDLDENETTETLDAPIGDIDYNIPFDLVASIEPRGADEGHARVVLRSGEELRLERSGDLGEGVPGVLVFAEGVEEPELVAWGEVGRIDLEK